MTDGTLECADVTIDNLNVDVIDCVHDEKNELQISLGRI